MKNFGMIGGNNTQTKRLRDVPFEAKSSVLWRRRKSAGKRVGFQPFLNLSGGPGSGTPFLKNRRANYPNISTIAILLLSIGFAHWAEPECGYGVQALSKTVDHNLRMRSHYVASLG